MKTFKMNNVIKYYLYHNKNIINNYGYNSVNYLIHKTYIKILKRTYIFSNKFLDMLYYK